jgi:hypothetical protein
MRTPWKGSIAIAMLCVSPLLAAVEVRRKPGDRLVAIIIAYLARPSTEWSALDGLPDVKWAPQPTELKNCLPDGGCYARQGAATVEGRNLTVMATGARTIVSNLYIRNAGAPIGEAAVVVALEQAGASPSLARCPVKGSAGSTNWYRIRSGDAAGVLAIQAARGAKPSEGFVVSPGDELPQLQPNQLALYSEACEPGAVQKPVSTVKPHVRVAEVVTALLVPASAPGLEWKALPSLDTGIEWFGEPKKIDLTVLKNDPNPMGLTGTSAYAGRKFSALASGTATQVRNVYLEEMGMHPKGEHMLGEVYKKGITVKLVRCGPVYTESTNNWYSLTSARTRPAMIQQSIGYDGNQTHESYALRLDGTLPARDPRDRDPGVGGCQ